MGSLHTFTESHILRQALAHTRPNTIAAEMWEAHKTCIRQQEVSLHDCDICEMKHKAIDWFHLASDKWARACQHSSAAYIQLLWDYILTQQDMSSAVLQPLRLDNHNLYIHSTFHSTFCVLQATSLWGKWQIQYVDFEIWIVHNTSLILLTSATAPSFCLRESGCSLCCADALSCGLPHSICMHLPPAGHLSVVCRGPCDLSPVASLTESVSI